MRTQVCNGLALYSNSQNLLDIQHWFTNSLKILGKYNLKPNFVGLTGNGFSKKMMPFKKATNQIEKLGIDRVESFTFMICPEDSDSPAYDWYVYFSLTNQKGGELICCIDQQIIDFNSSGFTEFILQFCSFDNFLYGYAYQREYSKGPEYYALGMGMGIPLNSIESEEIANWARDRRNENSIQHGFLRDVYRYNFLTVANLDKEVSGTALRDLINQPNGSLGSIQAINENLFLWKLTTSELSNARQTLKPMLICKSIESSS